MQTEKGRPLFARRDFKLLFIGSSVSSIGDQFTLVALPWLVLKLTGNPAALGLVLAAMALPRAVFMLIGGAIVDRMSPRRVLIGARMINAVLVALLAAVVLAGDAQMSLVYAVALGIGLATAFAYPAGSAILPQLVEREQLASANGVFMAMRQLSMFVGPTLAGLLIAAGAHPGQGAKIADAHGLGLAFGVDAVSFVASLVSLWMVRIAGDHQPPKRGGGVLGDVVEGVRAVWADLPLRAFMLYAGAVTVLVMGPIQVGMPMLANTRMDMGAASLGIMMAANGGGILVGSLLSRAVLARVAHRLGLMVLGIDAVVGLALAALSQVHGTWHGASLLAGVGILAGVAQIAVISWIQQRVPQAMMGRTMSLLMFVFMGLGPLSAAAAGAVLNHVGLSVVFITAGLALTVVALACMAHPALRSIRTTPAVAMDAD